MKRVVLLISLILVLRTIVVAAVSHLHSTDSISSPNGLVQATWKAEIREYQYVPSRPVSVPTLRLDFFVLGFQGKSGAVNLLTCIQGNVHQFSDDAFNVLSSVPGLGLYLTTQGLPDDSHGVRLNADPTQYPKFGRAFENIDGLNLNGHNIYSRQHIGDASPTQPILVRWTVTKVGVVTNPPGNLSRSLSGVWVPLNGTFVQWNVQIEINGKKFDVADYFLPLSVAEYVRPTDTFFATPEHFGASANTLDVAKTWVRFSDLRVSDGQQWYPMNHWRITFKDDADVDTRFGWRADESGLISSAGHEEDATLSARDPGTDFAVVVGLDCDVALPFSTLAIAALAVPVSLDIKPVNGCYWGTRSDGHWLRLTPGSALGAATVRLSSRTNTFAENRPATLRIGTRTLVVQQNGWTAPVPPPPVATVPDDLLSADFAYEAIPDLRVQPNAVSAAVPLNSSGVISFPSGSIVFVGPAFAGAGGLPLVMYDSRRNLVLLHPLGLPSSAPGASIAFTVPRTATYLLAGAFARANDFRNAGDGVDVLVIRNFDVSAPLFIAHMSSDNSVNADSPFSGSSTTRFSVAKDLNGGDVVRFVVFSGPASANAGFDITALTASLSNVPTGTIPGPVPLLSPGGIVNGASFQHPVAPGSIAAVFGTALAVQPGVASSLPLPTSLSGSSLIFNGSILAPLFFASNSQINIQVPWELRGQTSASVLATSSGRTSNPVNVDLAQVAPAIFTINQQGIGQGIVVIAPSGELAAPAGGISGLASRAVRRGEFITIYCTGLGEVSNTPATGTPTPSTPLSRTVVVPSVTIGGVSSPVTFAGLTPGFVGLYQVNVQVPAAAPVGPAVALIVSAGSAASNMVTLATQ